MNDLKIYAQNLESAAMEQIETLVNAPAFEGARIRIMPDAHAGEMCIRDRGKPRGRFLHSRS